MVHGGYSIAMLDSTWGPEGIFLSVIEWIVVGVAEFVQEMLQKLPGLKGRWSRDFGSAQASLYMLK